MFVEDWCYKKYGNKVTFVMGVYGSNTITYSWMVCNSLLEDIEEDKIIARLEESFVDKIWN